MDDSKKILNSLEKISDQLNEILFHMTPIDKTKVVIKSGNIMPRKRRDTEIEEE